MIVHPHTAGSTIRLKLSNLYGSEQVVFGSVNLALSNKDGYTIPGSDRHVTFERKSIIIIPAGREIYTDPVDLNVSGAVDAAISIYVPQSTKTSTWHFSPPQISYIAEGITLRITVQNSSSKRPTPAIGYPVWRYYPRKEFTSDCCSRRLDYRGSTPTAGSNHRWPDLFYDRLVREKTDREISVLNSGIVGNQILKSGPDVGLPVAGENVLSRLDRDVFSHPGITDVIF